jgi:hypothetical protein
LFARKRVDADQTDQFQSLPRGSPLLQRDDGGEHGYRRGQQYGEDTYSSGLTEGGFIVLEPDGTDETPTQHSIVQESYL